MSLTLRERIERTNFARLNHILIPETPEERARVREHWAVKRFGPAAIGVFRAFTRLGTGVVVAMLLVVMVMLLMSLMMLARVCVGGLPS